MLAIFRGTIVVLLLAATSAIASAQAVETYRVKKSDTMQTVAARFGLTVDELLEYNKGYKGRELQAREILIVPTKKERKEIEKRREEAALTAQQEPPAPPKPQEFTSHVVAPKETVYGISRQWGITQEMLKEYNPQLNNSVLKIGMELKIPVMAARDKVLNPVPVSAPPVTQEQRPILQQPGDTVTVAREIRTDTANVRQAEQLDVKRMLKVDVMLPFYLDKADSLIGAPAAERLADSRVGLSFYMGVRMALDSLAGQGLMADVRVFDTQRDTSVVDGILRQTDFSQTDLVIGPLYAEIAERVAGNLAGGKAIVVSPLSVKHDVTHLPNILQVSPSSEDMQQAVLKYMKDNLPSGQRIIVIASSTQQGLQIEKIRKILQPLSGSKGVEVLNTDLGENTARLAATMGQGQGMIIVVPSLTSSTVAEIFQAVEQSNRVGEVNVYCFEADARAKKSMEEAKGQGASRTRFVYGERHYENTGKAQYNDFVRAFRKRYRETPNTYSLSGFDITYDLLTRMALERDNEKGFTARASEQVADRYRFIKYRDGGYINTDVYILMYAPGKGVVRLY